jgi:hypothetical protein
VKPSQTAGFNSDSDEEDLFDSTQKPPSTSQIPSGTLFYDSSKKSSPAATISVSMKTSTQSSTTSTLASNLSINTHENSDEEEEETNHVKPVSTAKPSSLIPPRTSDPPKEPSIAPTAKPSLIPELGSDSDDDDLFDSTQKPPPKSTTSFLTPKQTSARATEPSKSTNIGIDSDDDDDLDITPTSADRNPSVQKEGKPASNNRTVPLQSSTGQTRTQLPVSDNFAPKGSSGRSGFPTKPVVPERPKPAAKVSNESIEQETDSTSAKIKQLEEELLEVSQESDGELSEPVELSDDDDGPSLAELEARLRALPTTESDDDLDPDEVARKLGIKLTPEQIAEAGRELGDD